jgi:hypothetical protein
MALVFKVNSNLSAFTCADAGFSMDDGTTGNAVSYTISAGTVSGVSPGTYSAGTNTYTATITVPSGYSNTGETINCTDTADGSGGHLIQVVAILLHLIQAATQVAEAHLILVAADSRDARKLIG